MHRLLIVGTGSIANHHAVEFAKMDGVAIVGCADAVPGRAAAFAEKHRIARAFDDLDAAIGWGAFDAAVNATSDAAHKPTSLALIAANKHVFCEKPLAPTYADALEMTEAAERAGIVNMVNLTYRNSPALQKAHAMVAEGRIGALRHVAATYLQSWLVGNHWGDWQTEERWLWRLSKMHGSTGVLGDVGIHILDFATFGAGETFASLKADLVTFPKAPGDRIGDYTLDANDSVAITGRLSSGALATVTATRFATGHANDLTLTLYGTGGALRVETDGQASRLSGCLDGDINTNTWTEIETAPVPRNAERFVAALDEGRNGEPSFRRAADVQRLIDATFESAASGQAVAIGG